ncbi:MAG: diacylglycerol kinase family lipid kinase [Bacteroidota bacterium]|nr:diacylglycerol kinase family lipid kinase [Bacteroidota bacterium]
MNAGHITFILNPKAGRGKAQHIRAALERELQHSDLNYSFFITTAPGEATALARTASLTSSIVVAIGGDGTVNEVASGLVGTNAAMAVLSEGSGNDFARIVNAPKNPSQLLSLLHNYKIVQYDSGFVRLTHSDGSITERSFFNSIGLGFDAAVAKKVSSIHWMRGIPLYLAALLHTLVGYGPHFFSVKYNNKEWKKNYFLLCVGNGRWEGGGFMLTPNALPDDGMFEVCGVTGDNILKVLPVLPSVMTGKHIGNKCIEIFDASSLVVECNEPFPVHGDGEIFGMKVKKTEISLVPKSLRVVVTHK